MQKTTILGILTILGGLINAGMDYLGGHPVNVPVLLTAITSGIGLIHASDNPPAK